MGKAPAFQFYPADWLASFKIAEMTLEEEGIYIRLLCYCWAQGSIPADPERCARIVGKGASVEAVTNVQRAFNESSTDVCELVHLRLEQEREKQSRRREQTAAAGRKSAEIRRQKSKNTGETDTSSQHTFNERSTGEATNVSDSLQRKVNPASSSSSSTAVSKKKVTKKKFTPPTVEEVADYCKQRGNNIDPEGFVAWHTARDWVLSSGQKCKCWKSCVITWEKRNGKTRTTTAPANSAAAREQRNANAFSIVLGEGNCTSDTAALFNEEDGGIHSTPVRDVAGSIGNIQG